MKMFRRPQVNLVSRLVLGGSIVMFSLTLLGSDVNKKSMIDDMSDFNKTCSKSEDTSKKLKPNSKIVDYDKRRENISSDGTNLKVEMPNLLESSETLCRDEKKTAEKGDMNISCNRSRLISATGNPLVPFEASHDIKIKFKQDSEDLQNALALLYRKRQELKNATSSEGMHHGQESHLNVWSTETKRTIEQLIMQETFSS